jgi:hypothetical protein
METALLAGELLGVWDTRDRSSHWWQPSRHEASQWAVNHIRDANSAYRVEFRLLDAPYAIVWRYTRNEQGRCFNDPVTDEVACDAPVVQLLDELPPAHLLGH